MTGLYDLGCDFLYTAVLDYEGTVKLHRLTGVYLFIYLDTLNDILRRICADELDYRSLVRTVNELELSGRMM